MNPNSELMSEKEARHHETGREQEAGREAPESKERAVLDEAAKEEEVRGLEARTRLEAGLEVARVKEQIHRVFEQVSRRQGDFAAAAGRDPALKAGLGRFLEFMAKPEAAE